MNMMLDVQIFLDVLTSTLRDTMFTTSKKIWTSNIVFLLKVSDDRIFTSKLIRLK